MENAKARIVGRSNKITANTPQQLRDMADLLESHGWGPHEQIDANARPTLRVTTRNSMELGPLVEFGLLI